MKIIIRKRLLGMPRFLQGVLLIFLLVLLLIMAIYIQSSIEGLKTNNRERHVKNYLSKLIGKECDLVRISHDLNADFEKIDDSNHKNADSQAYESYVGQLKEISQTIMGSMVVKVNIYIDHNKLVNYAVEKNYYSF